MAINVPVVKTDSITDHPNADRLSLVKVADHTVVTMKADDGSHRFSTGENVVYVPEGAIIPDDLLKATGFWDDEKDQGVLGGTHGNRVVNRKIRGIMSEGLIWKFADICLYLDNGKKNFDPQLHLDNWDDISSYLGITEYVPVTEHNVPRVGEETPHHGKFYSWPEIGQFRQVIKAVTERARYAGRDSDGNVVYNPSASIPTLRFRGTVKVHGTNAAIVVDLETGEHGYQSRGRKLTISDDNAGFALHMANQKDAINKLIERVPTSEGYSQKVILHGEWAGQGIQKGVAVSEVPKFFVIFGIRVIDKYGESDWIPFEFLKGAEYVGGIESFCNHESSIFNILQFTNGNYDKWTIDIDFRYPELVQNQLIEWTHEVEAECPVGKGFGVSGIGEGIVFQCITPGWRSSDFTFKSKGEKHAISKVSKIVAVDVEKVEAVREFVTYAVTENRLEWALNNLVNEQKKPFEMTSMGDFLRTLIKDIHKEEEDVIVANQLDIKKINSAISQEGRLWFIGQFNSGREE